MKRTRRAGPGGLLPLLLLLPLAACGRGGADGDDAGSAAGKQEEMPARVVSLSPTATEMLFAIGAGDQVIAVDDQSDYPADAPKTDLSGFEPNVEAIAGYEPDLVVISTDPGDLASSLERLGIDVIHHDAPKQFAGAYKQIREMGTATGHKGEADDLVAEMKDEIARLIDDLPGGVKGLTYYHELDAGLFSVTSATFIGAVYDLMGLENIADAAQDTAGRYPQLSAEFVVEADPDLIFLANAEFGESAETVAVRPGWSAITAVENGAVIPVDADISSRWGPRIVDFIREVSKHLGEHDVVDR